MHDPMLKEFFESGEKHVSIWWYVYFVFLAAWGGTASYITRMKRHKLAFSAAELVGEWTISGFAGIVTAYGCMYMDMGFYLTAGATGIAGHMGGRGLFLIEMLVRKRTKKFIDNGNLD